MVQSHSNDTGILIGIVAVLLVTGTLLPFINSAFDDNETTFNTDGIEQDIAQNDIKTITFILSITSMFFWTFGLLPFWIDLFFVILRIAFYILLYRAFRGF